MPPLSKTIQQDIASRAQMIADIQAEFLDLWNSVSEADQQSQLLEYQKRISALSERDAKILTTLIIEVNLLKSHHNIVREQISQAKYVSPFYYFKKGMKLFFTRKKKRAMMFEDYAKDFSLQDLKHLLEGNPSMN